VQWHGVGDGAVAVEEVGLEVAGRKIEMHLPILSQFGSRCFLPAIFRRYWRTATPY
jgi:hypothetical protein